MKLFIAEKPSVAKAIAAELGVSGRGDGFINCRNDVVVTWCFGHLLEQAEPDAYLPDDIPKTKKGRKIWRMQDLPIFPQHWLMEAKSERGAKKQLSVIGKLLKSAATVVNAGDPDREGQLLVDEVLEHFRARQPVERFWVSAVDPASIRKGLAKLGDNRSYAGMRDAARGRSRADWLLGMNLSRAYTLAGGDGLLAVGRVQTPTLFMVARRDYVVRNFTPVPYLSITADLAKETVPFTARWKPGPDQKGLDEEGRLLIDLDVEGKDRHGALRRDEAPQGQSAQGLLARRHPDRGEQALRHDGREHAQGLPIALRSQEDHELSSYRLRLSARIPARGRARRARRRRQELPRRCSRLRQGRSEAQEPDLQRQEGDGAPRHRARRQHDRSRHAHPRGSRHLRQRRANFSYFD